MTITLTIDSVDALPDGGPIRYQARNRSFEIGRLQHLDWSLPDPSRYISGQHCEVRFEKGGYWLYDVSRNGTFLNGSTSRMKSPYRLSSGDRLMIGQYVVSVDVEVGGASEGSADRESSPFPFEDSPSFSAPSDDIWGSPMPAPPPIDRRALMPEPSDRRRAPDFSNQFIDLPDLRAGADQARRPPADPYHDPSPAPPAANGDGPAEPPFAAQPVFTPRPMPVFNQPSPRGRPAAPPVEGEPFSASAASPPPASAPFAPAPFPPRAAPVPSADAAGARFLDGLARGAGVPPEIFAARDPAELGFAVGESLKVAVEQLSQLLRARAAAKAMTKSASRTMIGAADNNPLKFIPGAAEIIDVMFTRRRPGFLDAKQSLEAGFNDLKRHELATYAAMQKALARLLEDFSPDAIAAKVGNSVLSSKKSRSWDVFVERWEQKSGPHDNGILDVFLAYFAEAYDEASRKG